VNTAQGHFTVNFCSRIVYPNNDLKKYCKYHHRYFNDSFYNYYALSIGLYNVLGHIFDQAAPTRTSGRDRDFGKSLLRMPKCSRFCSFVWN
jgi:hypothetical protein